MFILHQYRQDKASAWVNDGFSPPFNVRGGCEFRFPCD